MYHSVNFGERNSWDDWHLIPSSKPEIVRPTQRSKWVEIPGADGQIELNRRLYGLPLYENRQGSLEFVVHDFQGMSPYDLRDEISDYLDARPMTLVLEDDPGFYYEGLFTLTEWKPGASFTTLRIDYILGPYRYEVDKNLKDWDPLDYEMSHANEITSLTVDEEATANLTIRRERVKPVFYCTAPMTVTHGGKTHNLPSGLTRNAEIVLHKGEEALVFAGHGRVQIDYRGGKL